MLAPAARRLLSTAALLLPALAACSIDRPDPVAPDGSPADGALPDVALKKTPPLTAAAGAVYTMTDAAGANAVLAFRRAADGALTPLGAFPTGGAGSGLTAVDPLGSQFSVRLSADRRLLFVVNAGSDDVSSFSVGSDGALALLDRESSGGDRPVSVAVHDRLLYVLNAGDGTLQGLKVGGSGKLNPVPHSTRDLDLAAGQAAEVLFTPDGRQLVVTIKDGPAAGVDSRIVVFPVLANDRLGEPKTTPALHPSAFGFDITDDDHVIVSETSGFVTSYRLAGGTLTPTASRPSLGAAVCWVVITRDGRYAYAVNAGSATIAGFSLGAGGQLTPIVPNTIVGATPPGSVPLDPDTSDDGRFLYVLEGATGAIARFTVNADGTLTGPTMTPAGGAKRNLQGLAAY